MKRIDPATWPRRSHYEFFRNLAHPHVGLTAEIDVSALIGLLKPAGISPFAASLYAITLAANRVPEFRVRFRGEEIVEHEVVHPSVTVPIEGERFVFCELEHADDWPTFEGRCRDALERGRRQEALTDNVGARDDWIFLTCLPWLRFTAMTHPTKGTDDCIPRLAWGRFVEEHGRWTMPVCVQAHHALIDGLHLGRFYEELQEIVSALPSRIGA
ncbi:chloramphenicol acetyltransferase [Oceanibacterium hippocampi]|uniref:Chloramphenicol acetyltransferase 3 n=1 Tax=Oceanibacterium hippocampi TaxID=745714 RepID=A0A1Y5U4H3_9PROT|nr:chloramphenicol acetyltransferase [Oceanibacterium hippocampi]SLN76736.1 Chloramphenicol acetyltransferase 3 [Oceanibacterium hippocampi]